MRAKRQRERQQRQEEQRREAASRRQEARAFRDTVNMISQELGETEQRVIEKIETIVSRLGNESALAYLRETQEIESQGGMLLADGSRRRTPGGVFFYLVKQAEKDAKKQNQQQPVSAPAAAPHPVQVSESQQGAA
jgi:phosphorylated adapter RNA export protein